MLIGVVSDTHGHVDLAGPAVEVFQQAGVERVIHCGDIGSIAIIELFADWETHFVFGNTDYCPEPLREAMQAGGHVCHERFGEVDWCGRSIAFLHGDDFQRLHQTIAGGRYDLVCSGHTHQAKLEQAGSTLVLNPGAVYRAAVHSVALVDLRRMTARHAVLS